MEKKQKSDTWFKKETIRYHYHLLYMLIALAFVFLVAHNGKTLGDVLNAIESERNQNHVL